MFLPLLMNFFIYACPSLGDAGNYILLSEGGWDVADLSVLTLSNGLVFSVLMLLLLKKALSKISFGYNYLIGAVTLTLVNMLFYPFLYSRDIGFYTMFGINFIQSFLVNLYAFLPQMATIGRFTSYLPEGFESTGVTLLVSICNMGLLTSGLTAAQELIWFDVKAGYYENIAMPMHINVAISVLLVLITPLFVVWRVRLKRKLVKDEGVDSSGNGSQAQFASLQDSSQNGSKL